MRSRVRWRVGSTVKLNVYEGERAVCQCHNVEDAARIVEAVNRQIEEEDDSRLTPRRVVRIEGDGENTWSAWEFTLDCGHVVWTPVEPTMGQVFMCAQCVNETLNEWKERQGK